MDLDWHLIPAGDAAEHHLTPACWCQPTLDEEMIVHHALAEDDAEVVIATLGEVCLRLLEASRAA